MLITILTPTYNRAYIIKKLYNSLLSQTNKCFEWIIIDDGSTDNTEELFEEIKKEKKINIKYIKKKNGGKHTALNVGVENATGEMLIIVDSDDYLKENAIERIITEGKKINKNEKYAGITFRKINIKTCKIIGNTQILNKEIVDTNLLDYRYKWGIKGDLAEVFKTEILKNFKFPEYQGEKFVPEALVWNRISKKYDMRCFNFEGIYYCEYLSDGYSQQYNILRIKNKKAYKQYYLEEIKEKKIPLFRKIQCVIRYIQLRIHDLCHII